MQAQPPFHLPAPVERATQRVRQAAQQAASLTVDGLGLAALAATQLAQRDALLSSQHELSRKTALFAAAFNECLDTEVARGCGVLSPSAGPSPTPDQLVASWESLTLMDDHEVEIHISADRFALAIAHSCEWELRECDAYMASLLGLPTAEHARNPLRAEVVAQALMRGVDAVSDRAELRRVLADHLGRSLAQQMRSTYAAIVAELRSAGLRPAGLALRNTSNPASQRARPSTEGSAERGPDSGHGVPHSSHHGPATGPGWSGYHTGPAGLPTGGPASRPMAGPATEPGGALGGHPTGPGAWAPSGPHSGLHSAPDWGTPMGRVEAPMMGALRRLARSQPVYTTDASGDWVDEAALGQEDPPGSVAGATNLIHAHRAELRALANGRLDHLVIDLVAGLFDQILADNKLPPPFVRLIARLQLPVLRAALGDADFFASRRHPVRRFVNRIASLGAAVDDMGSDASAALLVRIGELVQAVVDGDFDLVEVYERQLEQLESFVAAQAEAELQALGDASAVLARKEDELAQQQRFGQLLGERLRSLPGAAMPEYLQQFLSQFWSRAIARAELKEGPDSPLSQHLRATAREVVMSVQPKGSPLQRQQFLRRLPQLMKDLNLGLDHARCPAEARRAFFAQLLPGHAEALKSPPLTTLEHNLLVKQVDAALALPLPPTGAVLGMGAPTSSRPAPLQATTRAAMQALAQDDCLSPAEARAVGLLPEQAVDWHSPVDIDLGTAQADTEPHAPLAAPDIAIAGLPTPEAPEPTQGALLAEHLRLGQAYQMHLQGAWHTVKLSHVSPGHSFYVFTHGQRQRRTVSLTHRMLLKLCAGGRLRALEAAYLLERATARARRQLAALKPSLH